MNADERILTAIFLDPELARRATEQLIAAGVEPARISVLAAEVSFPDEPAGALSSAGVGAAVGGLAGAAVFAIPGIGAVFGAGWLAAALGGAITGSFAGGTVGALASLGVKEEEAHAYVEALRGGRHIVVVRAISAQAETVEAIFKRLGSLDAEAQRAVYRTEGREFE